MTTALFHPGIHAAAHPDKPAIIMAGRGVTVTYAELEARSNRGAHLFRRMGLKAGDSIAILMENNPHYLVICWAAQRAGLYYTCLPTHLTAPEADYIVGDCGAVVFITSAAKAGIAAELSGLMPRVTRRLMVEGTAPGHDSWEAATRDLPTTPIADETEGMDMLYSSGTTGRPKGVRIALSGQPLGTPGILVTTIRDAYRLDASAVYLSPAPLYHAAPLRWCMTLLRLGVTLVVMEKFDAETALALIEQHKVTASQWVPTMFVRLLKLPEDVRRRYDVSSLKVAVHAAAPCPVPVKEQMIAWWGPVLYEYYAGTEGNGSTFIDSHDWLAHKGSVGKARTGILHIMDEAGEVELPVGEVGVIYFSDGTLDGRVFEYWNDPERTAQTRNSRGWTTLGDVGRLDSEGYLYLTDRKSFMIISGGVNIYPQEIENLLVTHPKVLDVAVFGVPNEEFGEEVKAVVQPQTGADPGPALEAELIGFCRQHLSHVKCPRSVDFVDELPRHANGKLYKRLLRDRYWGNRDSRII